MKSSGVLFSRKRNRVKKSLAHTGKGMVLGSILVIVGTMFLPMWLNKERLAQQAEKLEKAKISFSDLLRIAADEAPEITEATYFTVEIPKIEAKAKIVSNVNSADKYEYGLALSKGVAHTAGTFLPGMPGAMTLFAHSTDFEANAGMYNAVFYRLDELTKGDMVTVWYLGKKYDYQVMGSQVYTPDNIEVFKTKPGEEKLYLVTCTPRGTTKNRLVVEANRV